MTPEMTNQNNYCTYQNHNRSTSLNTIAQQSKESAQVKDSNGKSSARHDNFDQIPKSIITQSKSVDAKTTQTEVVNVRQVTA